MSASRKPLLVVSASGRALAQSAARAGYPVVVLDLFDDLDMRDVAQASRAVSTRRGRFDASALLAAAERLCPPAASEGLVYGSGFEGRVRLLERLARGRQLFGNSPAAVRLLKDPDRLFPLLDRLGLSHPRVRRDAPRDVRNWLVKRTGGAGGLHVRPATIRHGARPDRYFQALQPGRVMSLLFAANGERAHAIGYNEQWTAPIQHQSPYRYGGAVSGADVPTCVTAQIESALDRLVRETGLVGLNGLDFILTGDVAHVIEVNPRPTATVDLYDPDIDGGMFDLHIRACQGDLRSIRPIGGARAHGIVYAWQAVRVPPGISWPAWCTDIPHAGSVIPSGAPICSVHAAASTGHHARRLAQSRLAQMSDQLQERVA
jgi:predicted ATP-grasp superfamily ATP-dependent carboligase